MVRGTMPNRKSALLPESWRTAMFGTTTAGRVYQNLGQLASLRVLSVSAMSMDDTNALIEQRKAKLAALRAKGIDPFKNKFAPTENCAEARANYAEGREVALAGRITAHRDMGKSQFIDIKDGSGAQGSARIQVYAQKQALGDEQFDNL